MKPSASGLQTLWLAGFNYLWALIDPDRQFLHDRIAGTRITWKGPGAEGSSG